ncbi:hypothetical protein Acr_03g0008040 [Actinidia rufa]|uniref:Uncharacterized protein n=1 Tax=Actinidia rufa TaxID=165716 RepID=A0A7J0ECC1_9ERIC|nr:hypothetical protein Acr_03g0008040 [Actinidia rufa]
MDTLMDDYDFYASLKTGETFEFFHGPSVPVEVQAKKPFKADMTSHSKEESPELTASTTMDVQNSSGSNSVEQPQFSEDTPMSEQHIQIPPAHVEQRSNVASRQTVLFRVSKSKRIQAPPQPYQESINSQVIQSTPG